MAGGVTGRETQRVIGAALAYWAAIFALGFVLGTIRVLWGAAALGETAFVLLEIPVMLCASWLAARWLVRRFSLGGAGETLAMGAIAFALLMTAEVLLAGALAGTDPRSWFSSLTRPPGLYGLLGQIGFALMPWLAWRGYRASDR